jgi:pimeloyl-ACP methyl ester carboxylesterase
VNGYADDLAAVIEAPDLTEVTLVGHSTGGGEVARYFGRHGTKRVAGMAHFESKLSHYRVARVVLIYANG